MPKIIPSRIKAQFEIEEEYKASGALTSRDTKTKRN